MGFDRVARCYRALEWLIYGNALQSARVAHLGYLRGDRLRVLILGDGDGRFLEALLKVLPRAEVDVVEASARMIELARRRVGDVDGVRFHHCRVDEFSATGSFDLVVSHFFLDCFKESGIKAVAEMVRGVLAEGGTWFVSDFQVPQAGVLNRVRAKVLLWVMYRFFGLTAGIEARRLIDPQPLLEATDFTLEARIVSNAGFLRADRWGG